MIEQKHISARLEVHRTVASWVVPLARGSKSYEMSLVDRIHQKLQEQQDQKRSWTPAHRAEVGRTKKSTFRERGGSQGFVLSIDETIKIYIYVYQNNGRQKIGFGGGYLPAPEYISHRI